MATPPLLVLGVRKCPGRRCARDADRHSQLAVPDESYFIPSWPPAIAAGWTWMPLCDDLSRIRTIADWQVPLDRVRQGATADARLGRAASCSSGLCRGAGQWRWATRHRCYAVPAAAGAAVPGRCTSISCATAGRGELVPGDAGGHRDRGLGASAVAPRGSPASGAQSVAATRGAGPAGRRRALPGAPLQAWRPTSRRRAGRVVRVRRLEFEPAMLEYQGGST